MIANNILSNRYVLVLLICVLVGCKNNYMQYDARSNTVEADDVVLFLELDVKDSCNKEYVYHIVKKRGKRGAKRLCLDSINEDYGVFLYSIDSVSVANRLHGGVQNEYDADYDYPISGIKVKNNIDLSWSQCLSIKNYSYGDAASCEIKASRNANENYKERSN